MGQGLRFVMGRDGGGITGVWEQIRPSLMRRLEKPSAE
jgi:hypothetical protein